MASEDDWTINSDAKDMCRQYASKMDFRICRLASIRARHRGSETIEVQDVLEVLAVVSTKLAELCLDFTERNCDAK